MIKYAAKTPGNKCVFCEIAAGRLATPGIFWQDDEFMAFLAIDPNTEGFSCVIPKRHSNRDVLKLPDDVLERLMVATKKVAKILENYFSDVGRVGVIMEGTGIDHAHIKLFPMHGTEDLRDGTWKQVHSGVDLYFEKYKGYIASNDGPKADEQKLRDLAKKLNK